MMTENIKFIRLKNGEDIIAETVEIEDESGILYLVINPLKIVYVQAPHNGYLQVSFIPWVFPKICDKQEFTLSIEDVLMISDVSEKMNEYYCSSHEIFQEKEEEPISEPPPEPEENMMESLQQLLTKRTYH